MKYYLAYGSNLNLAQMKNRCRDSIPIGTALLKDYKLLFKGSKTGSYLTVEKKKGSIVPLGVFMVSSSDEKRLDYYEGYPKFYYKKNLDIIYYSFDNKPHKISAFIYIMDERRKIGIPSRYYIDTCLKGYSDFGFDDSFLFNAYKLSLEEIKDE